MKTVLIVEDNDVNLELTIQLLEADYAILVAHDGEEGIAVAHEETPDLILMDLSLPKLDGWAATKRLKSDEKTKSIPVIALTAHAVKGDYERAMAAGCDSYLTKPVNEQHLLEEIERWIGGKDDE